VGRPAPPHLRRTPVSPIYNWSMSASVFAPGLPALTAGVSRATQTMSAKAQRRLGRDEASGEASAPGEGGGETARSSIVLSFCGHHQHRRAGGRRERAAHLAVCVRARARRRAVGAVTRAAPTGSNEGEREREAAPVHSGWTLN
jgi:hypothetical protein